MPFFTGAPPFYPEDDPTCFISLYGDKNLTEVWDTVNDRITVSTWADTITGYQFANATANNQPQLHKTGTTLNKYNGNQTLLFEGGDTGNEDWMDWPAGSLALLKNLSAFTFMGIFRPSAINVTNRLFAVSDTVGATNVLWAVEVTSSGNKIRTIIQKPGTTTTVNCDTSGITIAANTWYKIGVVVNYNYQNGSAAGRARIYVDEVNYLDNSSVFTSTTAANTVNANSLRGEIGCNLAKNSSFCQGNIAHMSFYQRSIEPEEQTNIWRGITKKLNA